MNEMNYRPFWRNRLMLRKVVAVVTLPLVPVFWLIVTLFTARGDLVYMVKEHLNEIKGTA